MTEDETVGWHHGLNGHEFAHTPGNSEGQGGLRYCSDPEHGVQLGWAHGRMGWPDSQQTSSNTHSAPVSPSIRKGLTSTTLSVLRCGGEGQLSIQMQICSINWEELMPAAWIGARQQGFSS